MTAGRFLEIASDLECAGLLWQPEIGDEVADRSDQNFVSILIDPQGMSPIELRSTYLWLPTVEQIIYQFEARQAVLFHAGFELTEQKYGYKTVIQTPRGHIETLAESFRASLGIALRNLLLNDQGAVIN